MPSSLQVLGLLASCLAGVSATGEWAFGNTFFIGPLSSSSNYIASLTYDMDTVPGVPTDYDVGSATDSIWVSPWVGIVASATDASGTLVQPLFNWQPDQESTGCAGATAEDWCVAASTYMPVGYSGQKGQTYQVVPSSAAMSFSITTTSDKASSQKVWTNGELISEQTDTMNALPKYITGTNECYTGSGKCGSLEAYTWTNVTVKLAEADANFGTALSDSGTTTSLTTSDEGLTWVGTIEVSADSWSSA